MARRPAKAQKAPPPRRQSKAAAVLEVPAKPQAFEPEPRKRPPRPKPVVADERYPSLDEHPALKRALVILRAMAAGRSREEAERMAEAKAGPRAPHSAARPVPKSKKGAAPKAAAAAPKRQRR